MPVAELAERRCYYERRGDGPPLLLIQGMAGHHALWGEAFLAPLAEHFDVVSYDHRGIGESTGTAPFSTADLAADALALMDHLGWARAHVLGISMGGMVAQHVAISEPGRVGALVIGCSYAGGAGSTLSAPGPLRMMEAMNTGNLDRAVRAAYEANLSAGFVADESHFAPFRAASLAVRIPVPVVLQQAQAAFAHNTSAQLPGVTLPTLVVHGTADEMLLHSNGEQIARLIPTATLHTVDGVGHLFWWERPVETAHLVTDHLATVPLQPAAA